MPPTEKARVEHIIDAATRASEIIRGRTIDDVTEDDVLSLALVRLIEIVGEAAKAVSSETRARYPEIPWQSMAAARDRLIHQYFDVNFDIVWEIVTLELPPLIPQLERIAAELPDEYAE